MRSRGVRPDVIPLDQILINAFESNGSSDPSDVDAVTRVEKVPDAPAPAILPAAVPQRDRTGGVGADEIPFNPIVRRADELNEASGRGINTDALRRKAIDPQAAHRAMPRKDLQTLDRVADVYTT